MPDVQSTHPKLFVPHAYFVGGMDDGIATHDSNSDNMDANMNVHKQPGLPLFWRRKIHACF